MVGSTAARTATEVRVEPQIYESCNFGIAPGLRAVSVKQTPKRLKDFRFLGVHGFCAVADQIPRDNCHTAKQACELLNVGAEFLNAHLKLLETGVQVGAAGVIPTRLRTIKNAADNVAHQSVVAGGQERKRIEVAVFRRFGFRGCHGVDSHMKNRHPTG